MQIEYNFVCTSDKIIKVNKRLALFTVLLADV